MISNISQEINIRRYSKLYTNKQLKMSFKVSLVFLFIACFGKLNAKLSCPDVSDGDEVYLPSDTNCGEYFHCVNGVPVEMKCPDGLWWDQANEFCNWPDQVSPPCTGKFTKSKNWSGNNDNKTTMSSFTNCLNLFSANCPSEGWIRKNKVSNCYLFGTEAMNFDEAQRVHFHSIIV